MALAGDMDARFSGLAAHLQELTELLRGADERFWLRFMTHGLAQVRAHRLAGATYVLGCYGGADTFSDFSLVAPHDTGNRRLNELRNEIFRLANAIAAGSAQIR